MNRTPRLSMYVLYLLAVLPALPLDAAAAQAADSAAIEITAAERARLIDGIADKLRQEYIDPDLATTMARALAANRKRGDYDRIAGGRALADRLTADLRAVGKDGHLWMSYRADGARDEPVEIGRVELEKSRPFAAADNFAFDRVERMPGNIGDLEFRIFAYPYLAADTAAVAMSFVAHTDALIVDLRDNGGGDPEMVTFMLSYLFDTRTHLNDIHFRSGDRLEQAWTLPHVPGQAFGGKKPVYVLTSKQTFSGAEDYSCALKNLKRATLVGEAPGGGAHPNREFRITEHFGAAIPFARSISPITHADWESTGGVPDVAVPAAQALDVAYRRALQGLAATTNDAGRRAELRGLLEVAGTSTPQAGD